MPKPLTTLAWAAYLACSWTWCIGMFLPVLLIRDLGLIAYPVFAVPNILGAAAMGMVLTPDSSRRLIEKHRRAMEAFSCVTIAFQAFFLLWLVVPLTGRLAGGTALMVALPASLLLLVFLVRSRRDQPRVLAAAVALWGLGLITVILFLSRSALPRTLSLPPLAPGGEDVLWLAPVCAFGFSLCPYLDPTFHKARQAVSSSAPFLLGFVVLFTLAIFLTFLYTPIFIPVLENVPHAMGSGSSPLPLLLGIPLFVHILSQLIFTVFVHDQELGAVSPRPAKSYCRPVTMIALAGAAIIAAAGGVVGSEVLYRVFMAFYGLVFPAYVWLVVIPTRDGHSGLEGRAGRKKRVIWAFAVGAAAPMFWLGFIQLQEFWLVPGLAVVIFARLALPRAEPRPGTR